MEIKLTYEKKEFEGYIIVRVATNIERLKIMEDIGISINDFVNDATENGSAGEVGGKFNNLSTMVKLLEVSEGFYKEVNLKKGEKEYKSFDDLNNDIACQEIQMDVAMKGLLNLGDSKKK